MKLYLLIKKEVSRPRENTEMDPITCKKLLCDRAGIIKMRDKEALFCKQC